MIKSSVSLAIMSFPRFFERCWRRVPAFSTARLQSTDYPPWLRQIRTAGLTPDCPAEHNGLPLQCAFGVDLLFRDPATCCSQDREPPPYPAAQNEAVRTCRRAPTHIRAKTHQH